MINDGLSVCVWFFAQSKTFYDVSTVLWQVIDAVKNTYILEQVFVDEFDNNKRHHHRRDNRR